MIALPSPDVLAYAGMALTAVLCALMRAGLLERVLRPWSMRRASTKA